MSGQTRPGGHPALAACRYRRARSSADLAGEPLALARAAMICGSTGPGRPDGHTGQRTRKHSHRLALRGGAGPVRRAQDQLDLHHPGRGAGYLPTSRQNPQAQANASATASAVPPPPPPLRLSRGEYRPDAGRAARRQHGRWLHQLTAATRGETILAGHGTPSTRSPLSSAAAASLRRSARARESNAPSVLATRNSPRPCTRQPLTRGALALPRQTACL